jgi:hypothetical protein
VRKLSTNGLKLLRLLQAGSFSDVARLRVSPDLAAEVEGHLRAAIHFALDRDIRSAAFLDAVRRSARAGPLRAGRAGSDGKRQLY